MIKIVKKTSSNSNENVFKGPSILRWRHEGEDVIAVLLPRETKDGHNAMVLSQTKYHTPGMMICFTNYDLGANNPLVTLYNGELTIKND